MDYSTNFLRLKRSWYLFVNSLTWLFLYRLLLLQTPHVVHCARLSAFGQNDKSADVNFLLKDLEDEEVDLMLSNFEYVKETPEKIRIGCTGEVDPGNDYSEQGSTSRIMRNKRVKSLFIRDADGHKDIQRLSHTKAMYRNDSGMLEERKIFLREFPEECFRILFGSNGASLCPPGPPGKNGNAGVQGKQGKRGFPGLPGKAGTPGANGISGPPGLDGDPGPQGDDGDVGDQGFHGTAGLPGNHGAAGPDGEDWKADSVTEIN